MMTAAGTIQFKEGTGGTAITPVLPIDSNAGFVALGTTDSPVLFTPTKASKLTLTAATGTARGWFHYFLSSDTP